MTAAERFWSRVVITPGCWTWTGSRNRKGYGYLNVNGLEKTAHRAAYALTNGPVPDGLWVLHRCDNPPCCNPGHLFLGTNADNVADRVAKGRTVASPVESSTQAKLTDAAVIAIREACATGARVSDVAASFGVSPALVSRVRRRQGWTHVAGPASERRPLVSTGQRYGRLTVLEELPSIVYPGRVSRVAVWLVRCDCGTQKPVRAASLRLGDSRSCGCIKSEMLRERNRRTA